MAFRELQNTATETPQSGGFRELQTQQQPEQEERPIPEKHVGGLAGKFLNSDFFKSEKGLGSSIGSAMGMHDTNAGIERTIQTQTALLDKLRKVRNQGGDTTTIKTALAQSQRTMGMLNEYNTQNPLSNKSNTQIFGETAGTLLDLTSVAPALKVSTKLLNGLSPLGKNAITGLVNGAIFGGMEGFARSLQDDQGKGDIATKTALGAVAGGVFGTALGVVVPGASRMAMALKDGNKPANIMQRVARISKGKQAKFEKTAGESVGEYLTKRGIFGDIDEITSQLYKRFESSKKIADDSLEQIDGLFEPEVVKTALEELIERETRVSSPGALSPNLSRVKRLNDKLNQKGLSMSEINEVKRLYESNIKLDYLRQNLPESIAKANNVDDAIRTWQFDKADEMGLKNLPEINRETRLARQLADDLGTEYSGSAGNNAITLTDWIVLSGGEPSSVGAFLAKKTLSGRGVRSSWAKYLYDGPSVGFPKAQFETPFGMQPRLGPGNSSPRLGGVNQSSNNVPIKLPTSITEQALGKDEIRNAVIKRTSRLEELDATEETLFNKIVNKQKLTSEEESLLNRLVSNDD
jgi:hypothetical protein